MIARHPAEISNRFLTGLSFSLVGGIAVGYLDARPGWDDTGVTAVLLILVGGVGALVARRAPWAVALLCGAWVPIFEWSSVGSGGPLAAFIFSGLGAALGWLVARR